MMYVNGQLDSMNMMQFSIFMGCSQCHFAMFLNMIFSHICIQKSKINFKICQRKIEGFTLNILKNFRVGDGVQTLGTHPCIRACAHTFNSPYGFISILVSIAIQTNNNNQNQFPTFFK